MLLKEVDYLEVENEGICEVEKWVVFLSTLL